MLLIKLYFEFFKIGLFSIGGGLATLPFLQNIAKTQNWITTNELVNMIAISESTPGPIGINTATFVGFKAAGIIGGITITLGIITPSIIIIIFIAHFFQRVNEKPLVKGIFLGIRPAVTGLIASVGFTILQISILNIDKFTLTKKIVDLIKFRELTFFIIIMFIIRKYHKHPILYLIIGASLGIILKF